MTRRRVRALRPVYIHPPQTEDTVEADARADARFARIGWVTVAVTVGGACAVLAWMLVRLAEVAS